MMSQKNGDWRGVDQVGSENGSGYQPNEVFQLPSLLTTRGTLGNIR